MKPPPLPPSVPPPLPSAVPPVLPTPPGSGGRLPKKPLSAGRRWARRIVWATLAVVLVGRWLHPPDPEHSWGRMVGGNRQQWGGGGDGRRFRRAPARVQPPVTPVPADLWRLEIQIAPKDVSTLRNYQWDRPMQRGGQKQERPEVLATVREGGRVYTNVAIHLKGSMGSFRPFDDKPAMTLNFSKHAKGQEFHGFTKLSLNNSVQDSTYLSEALCRELFTAAGAPAPAASHATVVMNERDLGLYVAVEGWGKTFLRRHFKDVGGNLYEGGFASDIAPDLEVNSGDHPEDRTDLNLLLSALGPGDAGHRWERLKAILDVDRFASQLAMEVLTCHWDGYSLNRNNYRLFHDLTTDRLVFLPHGMDQMFGSMGRMPPSTTILPQMQGMVARVFMSTREGKALYLDRIVTLSTNLMVPERLVGRVRELAARIRPTLAAYGSDLAQMHDAEVAELCRRIEERCESVARQLEGLPEETRFDAEGIAAITGWRPRTGRPDGNYLRAQGAGTTLLTIRGGAAGSQSWRMPVILNPGEYEFQGRGRYKGPGVRGGLRLRISRGQAAWMSLKAGEWTPLTFEFEVTDPMSTVELVCEFADPTGEADFDEQSLRLVRK